MNREAALASLMGPFDVLVIGGGATGLGIALDAATRGFRTALAEAADFAQATSSRSTKLVHGGVRYLASGNISLVREALHERAVMMRNAPHLVHPQPFVIPAYKRLDLPFYGAGLLLYDFMSGRDSMGPTHLLGRAAVQQQIPNIQPEHLSGGVLYHDGQFNDARYALALARTAQDRGAVVLNYLRCSRLLEENGRLTGAMLTDRETGAQLVVRASVIYNATGIFTDELRTLDEPQAAPLLTVSRGSHIVVPADVLGGSAAIMVPKTRDGRVIFAIPWQGRVLIGTTDVPDDSPSMEPGHTAGEIDFLIETLNPYLARKIGPADILSVFSGLRPLVSGKAASTAKLSREHLIDISANGLITVTGGKWTTYRRMAQDAIDFAGDRGLLPSRPCITGGVALHGAPQPASAPPVQVHNLLRDDPWLQEYGSDIPAIEAIAAEDPTLRDPVDPALPYTGAQVVFAARQEMARSVEDVLSRRTRALLLDSAAALRAAPRVASLLARELGRDDTWPAQQLQSFSALLKSHYAAP